MRLFLLLTLLLFSACTATPEVSKSAEEESHSRILANKTNAQHAKYEYKQLQNKREQE